MELHADIELLGGPEDGRAITIPVTAQGTPVSPLGVPSPHDTGAAEGEVSWYQRAYYREHGVWIYRYTNHLGADWLQSQQH